MATFNNLGFNLRLSDIQAAVGVAQMAKLDRLLAERRRLGRRYSELLAASEFNRHGRWAEMSKGIRTSLMSFACSKEVASAGMI